MQCSSHVTPAGGLAVQAHLSPADLNRLAALLSDLLEATKAAQRMADALEAEHRAQRDALAAQAAAMKRAERLALSVFRRTGSLALAAQASGLPRVTVRAVLQEAGKRQRQAHTKARHRRVLALHAAGWPAARIAAALGLHRKSVPRIIRTNRDALMRFSGCPGIGGRQKTP